MIGLESGCVHLSPYQPEWARLFQEECGRLQTALGGDVLEIQHVGSTAVPDLPAKPIIDIGIAVNDFEEAAVCIQPIERLGYIYRGENGIPRRHYFRKGDPTTHHIHMNEIESVDWANLILFRDYLRRHSDALRQYADLKIELSRQFPRDRERYLNSKAPFIERILRLARKEG